jgi:hypothetical protein
MRKYQHATVERVFLPADNFTTAAQVGDDARLARDNAPTPRITHRQCRAIAANSVEQQFIRRCFLIWTMTSGHCSYKIMDCLQGRLHPSIDFTDPP